MLTSQCQCRSRAYVTLVALVGLIGVLAPASGCGRAEAAQREVTRRAPATGLSLEAAIIEGDDHAVRAHILAGADVNARTQTGDTPLHIAAALGRPYAAMALVGAGAELEARNAAGVTPLFNAAFFCHPEVVSELIRLGADTETHDAHGSPLLGVMELSWAEIEPVYVAVFGAIGLPFDAHRIEAARPTIAGMLR